MRFQVMRRCRRPVREQRYIWAAMEVYARLPEERKAEVREVVAQIARTPAEGRALFDLAVRGIVPGAVCAKTGVSLGRLYRMRDEFYNRLPL